MLQLEEVWLWCYHSQQSFMIHVWNKKLPQYSVVTLNKESWKTLDSLAIDALVSCALPCLLCLVTAFSDILLMLLLHSTRQPPKKLVYDLRCQLVISQWHCVDSLAWSVMRICVGGPLQRRDLALRMPHPCLENLKVGLRNPTSLNSPLTPEFWFELPIGLIGQTVNSVQTPFILLRSSPFHPLKKRTRKNCILWKY